MLKTRRAFLALPVLMILLAGTAGADDAAPLQIVPAVQPRQAPKIDGSLNDAAWKKIKPFSPFYIAGTRTPAPVRTEVKACYTRDALYFGVKLDDPHSPNLKAAATKHDGPVWNDDSIEVFINPEDKAYYQFLVNSKGVRADLKWPRGEGGIQWNAKPDWTAKTSAHKGYWIIEMKVPFASIWPWKQPPTHGDRFRLKIVRSIQSKTGNTNDEMATSWNILKGRVFADNRNWRSAVLGGDSLLPPLSAVASRRERRFGNCLWRSPWHLEDQSRSGRVCGGWEFLKAPAPGIGWALKVTRTDPKSGQNPRLFMPCALRPGHRYRLSMKVRGDLPVGLTINSKPWLRHISDCFKPPKGGWKDFAEVSETFAVGDNSAGRDRTSFIYLWLPYGKVGSYTFADIKLEEVQSAAPGERKDMLKHHGMTSLRESNFGVKPVARMNRDKLNGHDASRVIYRDSVTGVEIWKVTHFPRLDRLIGTGRKSWSADGRFFAVVSYDRPWTNMMALLNADATRVLSSRKWAAPIQWAPKGHVMYIVPFTGVYAFDPVTRRKWTVFEIPKGKRFPGRNWIKYEPSSNQVLQYSWQFGKKAVLRLWDVKTMTYRDIHARSYSKPQYKPKDWLYGARFRGPDTIIYGLNHKPHLSANNVPQAWLYHIKEKRYERPPDVERGSHGAMSPGGKRIAYFRSGLGYRKNWGSPLIHIGGLGGDGHMCFLYQDRIAATGDVSPGAMVTMVYPDTRNVVLLTYAQNRFTGYYGSIIFVSMSPDVTKMCYTSDMMGYRDMYWAVMNYPRPPRKVRVEPVTGGAKLRWDPPEWGAEVKGYLVYASDRSGGPWRLAEPKLIATTEWVDKTAGAGPRFYAVRAVEQSGLASRAFSDEAAFRAGAAPRRLYFEAESFTGQQIPFRLMIDKDAVNEKLVWILPKKGDPARAVGKLVYRVGKDAPGVYRLWARVRRGLGSGAKCELKATVGGQGMSLTVTSPKWTWQRFPGQVRLKRGSAEVVVTGRGKGLCVDRFLLTSDATFTPKGKGGDIPTTPPAAPTGLLARERRPCEIRLAWAAKAGPEFGHFQVYRKRGKDVKAEQTFLVGSPGKAEFLDYNLRPGETYSYAVTAVDNWGKESKPCPVLVTSSVPLVRRVVKEIALADVPGLAAKAEPVREKGAKGVFLFAAKKGERKSWRLPFEVEADGEYAIWLHAAVKGRSSTVLAFEVDGERRPRQCRWVGPDAKKGQRDTERLQWDRLMHFRQDAGAVFQLKKGKHTLRLSNWFRRPCALLVEKMLITNDLSYIPPGERFIP